MSKYLIHDLISINTSSNLNKLVAEGIDFQIGYFKVREDSISKTPYTITVRPYLEFEANTKNNESKFYLLHGVEGLYINDSKNKIAIRKTPSGFDIYTQRYFLINLYIEIILLEKKIVLVHAASVSDKCGNIILLPGPGGVGKTALLGMLVQNDGYKILGDDIVAVSADGNCYSFPRSFVLKNYHREVYPRVFKELEKNIFFSSSAIIKKHFVFLKDKDMSFIDLVKKILYSSYMFFKSKDSIMVSSVPVVNIFGNDSICSKGKISKIIFMERYKGKVFIIKEISINSLCNKMFSIILYEWVNSMGQFFTLGAMELINLPEYFRKTQDTLKAAIMLNKKSKILIIPDNSSPQDLYQYFSKHN